MSQTYINLESMALSFCFDPYIARAVHLIKSVPWHTPSLMLLPNGWDATHSTFIVYVIESRGPNPTKKGRDRSDKWILYLVHLRERCLIYCLHRSHAGLVLPKTNKIIFVVPIILSAGRGHVISENLWIKIKQRRAFGNSWLYGLVLKSKRTNTFENVFYWFHA